MRNHNQPSILAVDDEPPVLEALSAILQAHGYRFRTARNGSTALDAIAAESRQDAMKAGRQTG